MRSCECPKCGTDIADSYEPADYSVGIMASGWCCGDCDLFVPNDGREPLEGDVAIPAREPGAPLGTPIDQLSGRPDDPGFEEFKRIAASWGYD